MRISYFEIYNEKIRDLLNPRNTNLEIKISKNEKVPYLPDVTIRFVSNAEEALAIVEEGKYNRALAVTSNYRRNCLI